VSHLLDMKELALLFRLVPFVPHFRHPVHSLLQDPVVELDLFLVHLFNDIIPVEEVDQLYQKLLAMRDHRLNVPCLDMSLYLGPVLSEQAETFQE